MFPRAVVHDILFLAPSLCMFAATMPEPDSPEQSRGADNFENVCVHKM